ncbi:hypothetical protein SAMN05192555_103138 [Franzmannia pantelleriensis]|uniref:Uncharacterized protein n=1 Tax=Franzmannia pantelleriensis TaxID=48727 RepID=A0A1G9IDZ8_9GAMM|nr:hypothetical protein SAMN05192555_103138 [Halomonas pantelleriensis]
MKPRPTKLQVHQVNCFYNYTAGLDVMDVDLLKTATNLLKSGMVQTVCFSDLKCVYLDAEGAVQLEWLRPQGRQWDSRWTVKFSENLPDYTAKDLIFCLELSFHEQRIEGAEARQLPPHLRAALPPVVLERDDWTLPIHPWLKLYSDGIIVISFQLDTTWSNLDEADFIQEVVNLFQNYFNRVWVQADLQRMDAEQIIPCAYERELSIGGQGVIGRKSQKLVKELRRKGRAVLDDSLRKEGQTFEIDGKYWVLHQIAGSEDQAKWEATIDLCRSIYVSAVAGLAVARDRKKGKRPARVQLWQGRPSISLMRFVDQPDSKEKLLKEFGPSISRVLSRSAEIVATPDLPPDMRPFEDYCFHGNRALLLWTWLRATDTPDDAWEDANTQTHILENQARAEHFEYHNLRIARACATASSPPSDEHLIEAYEVLAGAESVIHHSSQAGEITDALYYLLAASGTTGLVESGKEQARWHLDERRYRTEKKRAQIDRWLAGVFGFVGVAGLADLVVQPFLTGAFPDRGDAWTGLTAFALSLVVVGFLTAIIWVTNKLRRE